MLSTVDAGRAGVDVGRYRRPRQAAVFELKYALWDTMAGMVFSEIVAYSHQMRAPLPAAPRGTPSGSVLDFGRYAGWSLGQIATADAVYLEWLARTPIGRSFNREIDALLATHRAATEAADAATAERRPRRSRSN